MNIAQRLVRRILTALTGVDVLVLQESAERSYRRSCRAEDDLCRLRAECEQLRAQLAPTAGTVIRWRGVAGVQS